MLLQEEYCMTSSCSEEEVVVEPVCHTTLAPHWATLCEQSVWYEGVDFLRYDPLGPEWRHRFHEWCNDQAAVLWQLAIEKEFSVLCHASPQVDQFMSEFWQHLIARVHTIADCHVSDSTMTEKRLKTCVRSFMIQYIEHKLAYSYAFVLASQEVTRACSCCSQLAERGRRTFELLSEACAHRSHFYEWKKGWEDGWSHGLSKEGCAACCGSR